MEKDTEIPLLEAMTLLQGTILSCIDKKQFPYSKTQLNIFIALAMEEEMTMKQIARHLACSQEQATRAVAPLADAGYVERRTDPANRTRVHVHLTEQGKQYLREQTGDFRARLSDRLDNVLSEEETVSLYDAAVTLAALLRKIRAADLR